MNLSIHVLGPANMEIEYYGFFGLKSEPSFVQGKLIFPLVHHICPWLKGASFNRSSLRFCQYMKLLSQFFFQYFKQYQTEISHLSTYILMDIPSLREINAWNRHTLETLDKPSHVSTVNQPLLSPPSKLPIYLYDPESKFIFQSMACCWTNLFRFKTA